MKKNPLILIVINDLTFLFSHRLPIIKALKKLGYNVQVAAPKHDLSGLLEKKGIPFHPIELTRRGINPLTETKSLFQLYHLYKKIRPDVLHHVTIKPVIYGGMAARLAKIPVVISAISGLGSIYIATGIKAALLRSFINFFYSFSLVHPHGRVIFQNPDDLNFFLENDLIKKEYTTLIKGSGVNMNQYSPTPEPKGLPLVVLAARMLRDKGVIEFVEAAWNLKEDGIQARFALVGDTDIGNPSAISISNLKEWERLGIVEWWGHRRDIPDIFAKSHLVVLPSYREGLPKVLIEAAACARAIVTTNVPGCRDAVRDGINGLLVEPRDPNGLASAIKRLLEDSTLRHSMGARGREIALNEFSEEQVVNQTLDVYQKLLSQ